MPAPEPRRREIRLRLLVIGVWLAIAAALLSLAGGLHDRLDVAPRVDGSGHQRAADIVAREFASPFADPLILLVDGVRPGTNRSDASALAAVVAAVESEPGVARTLSWLDGADPLFLGASGQGAIVLVSPERGAEEAALTGRLRAAADAAAARFRSGPDALPLHWTGEAALSAELREFAAREATTAEMRVTPVVLILLLAAFGSIVAAFLPAAVGLFAVTLALGIAALVAERMSLSIVLINVVTMLGLGLSIDYALLMVSRFREELADHPPPGAARIAAATAGRTIALSGGSVAIALAALLLVPVNEIRSIALGGLIVTAAAVLVSTTLLPVLLSFLGGGVDRLAFLRRFTPQASAGLWERWAAFVFRRPLLVLLAGLAPIAVLAVQSARLDVNLPRGGNWLPSSSESVQSLRRLKAIDRSGLFHAVQATVAFDSPDALSTEAGWRALDGLVSRIEAHPQVAEVRAITTLPSGPRPWEAFARLPPDARAAFVSRDGSRALIAVIPRDDAQPFELSQLVRKLRATAPPAPIASVEVGGGPALNADYTDAVQASFPAVALFVMLATFVALAIGYRSVVLPLKAVVLNLASVAASMGALVLVFQDGFGIQLLGLDGPLGGVFPNVPILVFGIVFGLSMDYEVFLFNRVVEAHREGLGDSEAMTLALRRTAGVITSAAAIMIVVFSAFMAGEFLFMKMLGFTLAAAILIDATLVRLVIAPAVFALAGEWNWWPRRSPRAPAAATI